MTLEKNIIDKNLKIMFDLSKNDVKQIWRV